MTDGLALLGDVLANRHRDPRASAEARVPAQIRQSIGCLGFAALSEMAVVPGYARQSLTARPGSWLDAQQQCFALATLAAASDLDPLDLGPAHLALPSTITALVAARLTGADDHDVEDAVLYGTEVAARLRAATAKSRPGIGFHSGGTFGLLSAAATASRMLGLDAGQTAAALAIGFTRAGGLAVNSAQTRIGLTHFGFGAAHGLEAAVLAADGWSASDDLDSIFQTLFGSSYAPVAVPDGELLVATRPPAFKLYACNIYVNLAILAADRIAAAGAPLTVVMPQIRHLDNAEPRDVREVRNSVQGGLAVARASGPSYRAYTSELVDLSPVSELSRGIAAISVRMDPGLPTSLVDATVTVEQGDQAATCGAADLTAWDDKHLSVLTTGFEEETAPWSAGLLSTGYLESFQAVITSVARSENG